MRPTIRRPLGVFYPVLRTRGVDTVPMAGLGSLDQMAGTHRPRSSYRRVAAALGVAALVGCIAATGASGAVLADYPDFADTSGLTLNGDAFPFDGVLELTDAGADETGTAFTTEKVLNPKRSWKTQFAISLHDTLAIPGDGMAFVVQSVGNDEVGDGGGGLGYGSLGDSVAVEFDTFDNGGTNEDANEVAVTTNGKAGRPLDRAEPGFAIYGAAEINAWAKYSAKSTKLKVWVNDDGAKPKKPLLSAKKNLNGVLEGKSYAGFTAATGGATENHDVFSWKLTQ
jgi:Legume lectin domain